MKHHITLATVLGIALLARPVAAVDVKLGYVDLQRALNEVDEGKAAKALLKKDFEEKQKQLDAGKTDFEKARADFDKQQVVMSDQAKRDKASELDRRAMELQATYQKLQQDLMKREQEMTGGIFQKMSDIVREMAEADGITMVLERNAGVVYALPALDLTNELIRKYNARHPPTSAAAPAAAAAAPKKDAAKAPAAAKPAGDKK